MDDKLSCYEYAYNGKSRASKSLWENARIARYSAPGDTLRSATPTSVIPPFAILIAIPNDPWPQLIVTLGISLLLFAFYIPITRIISKLYEQGGAFI